MARTPSRRALSVTLGVLIGALLPAVYGLQLVLDQTLGTAPWLEGSIHIRVTDQDPLLLALTLLPTTRSETGLEFEGAAALLQPVYPWQATEFSGRIWLRLEEDLLSGSTGIRSDGWSATYFVGDTTGTLTRPPAPCLGHIDVSELGRRTTDGPQTSTKLTSLTLRVQLKCVSPGPDGRPATGDDRTWLLDGDLGLRRGRRPAASTAL